MPQREQLLASIDALLDEQRSRCLWFLRPDWRPRTDAERQYALLQIKRNGDAHAFRRAAELSAQLSALDRTIQSSWDE